jgi:hypothetical protein
MVCRMNPFKAVENLILGPPRLFVRTLDDFHTLVEIAADTNKRLDRIEHLAVEMTQQLAILVKLVSVLEQGGETVIAAAKRVDTVARDVMSLGDRIEAGPEALKDMGSRVEEVAGQIAAEGRVLQQRAKELAEQGAEVAAAVPFLQRAMEVAGPSLESALSRLGQFVAPSQPARSGQAERPAPLTRPAPAAPADEAPSVPAQAAKPSAAAKPPATKRPAGAGKPPATKGPGGDRRPSGAGPRPAPGQA